MILKEYKFYNFEMFIFQYVIKQGLPLKIQGAVFRIVEYHLAEHAQHYDAKKIIYFSSIFSTQRPLLFIFSFEISPFDKFLSYCA